MFVLWRWIQLLWSPASRKGLKGQLNRMMESGVNPWNKKERKSWIRKHRSEVRKAVFLSASRNEPCPCGSGKKFKKCCG